MQLYNYYRNILQITEEAAIEEAIKATEIRVFQRGDYLIQAGEIPTHVSFLMRGVIRGILLDLNGKDITDCIMFRCGNPVVPDSDFTQPASITLEALTDVEIVTLPLTIVVHMLDTYPSMTELYHRLLSLSVNLHRGLKIATYQYTAAQRYKWFLREYPGLIDQIHHKYIASLLNMTPVTLSKIRNMVKCGETEPAKKVH